VKKRSNQRKGPKWCNK